MCPQNHKEKRKYREVNKYWGANRYTREELMLPNMEAVKEKNKTKIKQINVTEHNFNWVTCYTCFFLMPIIAFILNPRVGNI